MDKKLRIDEIENLYKDISNLNDEITENDIKSRKLYEMIGEYWKNDTYISDMMEENIICSTQAQYRREEYIRGMKDTLLSEIKKLEEDKKEDAEGEEENKWY